MAVTYQNKAIVTDGLVFYVDAANKVSYPGSGTSWKDLISNQAGTLTNGPTFSSLGKGSILFDGTLNSGTNDCVVDIPSFNIPGAKTVSFWVLWNNNGGAGVYGALFGKSDSAGTYYPFIRTYGSNPQTKVWIYQDASTGTTLEWDVVPDYNRWYHICITGNGSTANLYIDKVLTDSGKTDRTLNVDQINAVQNNYGMDGNISNMQIYNRQLSASEVAQNYNALKGRFE